MQIISSTRKVYVSPSDVQAFNTYWPYSTLRCTRGYWFEFASNGDLVDTDVPEQDDGAAAVAMADDCKNYLETGVTPDWAW